MVIQDEHRAYPGSGHEMRNTLRPASLWIVLIRDDDAFWGRSLLALYSSGGKVIDLRNLILADYNSCIHRGYNIYPNRLCFLDHQVDSACSARFAEQFGDPHGPFWQVGPPCLVWPMWSHEGIRVYTPTASPWAPCILKQHAVLTFFDQWGLKSRSTRPEAWSAKEYSHPSD
jgi:hypothetical protein